MKPKTIEVHGYTVRRFTIQEYSELSVDFKGAISAIESLSNDEKQAEALIELITNCLPSLIRAVSFATDSEIEKIQKIDDMEVFGDLLISIKDVNDFLALGATVKKVMNNLFQQKN